ncbi:hypothetical protein D9756_006942 [Leucocoprinus leucothites]|uniref:Uncharacterized protein n=1 Tax=Leucocoprinus leucothites TaxID=201217 RepID=A0A8H5D6G0_9AGAR|nr:hypothetical protein D9756_006942 [Leucoagaricus leucothites]
MPALVPEGCAVNTDGQLKNTTQIKWFHNPNDNVPLNMGGAVSTDTQLKSTSQIVSSHLLDGSVSLDTILPAPKQTRAPRKSSRSQNQYLDLEASNDNDNDNDDNGEDIEGGNDRFITHDQDLVEDVSSHAQRNLEEDGHDGFLAGFEKRWVSSHHVQKTDNGLRIIHSGDFNYMEDPIPPKEGDWELYFKLGDLVCITLGPDLGYIGFIVYINEEKFTATVYDPFCFPKPVTVPIPFIQFSFVIPQSGKTPCNPNANVKIAKIKLQQIKIQNLAFKLDKDEWYQVNKENLLEYTAHFVPNFKSLLPSHNCPKTPEPEAPPPADDEGSLWVPGIMD